MKEIFINNAEAHLQRALHHANNIKDASSKTEILNANYCMGQYHAYMQMLEITDLDAYIELGEKHSETANNIQKAINKLYG